MIRMKFVGIAISIITLSCNNNQIENKSGIQKSRNLFSISEIQLENSTPTVDIQKFTLIENSENDLKNEAKEILTVKRKWPLAMQSQNPAEFDSILAKDFTFKGIGEFFNRKDYIENRVKPDDWKITFVKYENVCLEFINDNLAILSYKNSIKNVNSKTKEIESEIISWVDIYIKENNNWKIKSAHAIDYRLEK
ncbi:nuclear transport factor 2 family protein [Flavobacterium sp.]|uniref:nuclear transport factor 2 family protein n=1 Tax=Flavobacterium sp. TaxID=239 RepID=UPI0039E2B555